MFGSSISGVSLVGFHLHWLFCTLFFFGLIAALIWFARFASKQQLKSAIWTALVVGGIGMVLTAGSAFNGMRSMMEGVWDRGESDDGESSIESEDYDRYRGMMDWYFEERENEASETSEATETTTTETVVE